MAEGGLFELRLRGDAFVEQLLGAFVGQIGGFNAPFGRGEIGFRRLDRQLVIGGVDAGKSVAQRHPIADIDEAFGDLAGDAKAEVHLRARLDRAGIIELAGVAGPGDLDDLHRPDDLFHLGLLLRAGGKADADGADEHEAGDGRHAVTEGLERKHLPHSWIVSGDSAAAAARYFFSALIT